MRVVWGTVADRDRAAITEFLAERNRQAAADVIERLTLAVDGLATFPNRGRPGLVAGTRELVSVWPYVVVYRVHGDTVRVLRVWHGAQSREG